MSGAAPLFPSEPALHITRRLSKVLCVYVHSDQSSNVEVGHMKYLQRPEMYNVSSYSKTCEGDHPCKPAISHSCPQFNETAKFL
jgi:hypothetical protein